MKNIVFSLPYGMEVGGVNTWSIAMSQKLAEMGQSAVLIEHRQQPIADLDVPLHSNVRLITCKGPNP